MIEVLLVSILAITLGFNVIITVIAAAPVIKKIESLDFTKLGAAVKMRFYAKYLVLPAMFHLLFGFRYLLAIKTNGKDV